MEVGAQILSEGPMLRDGLGIVDYPQASALSEGKGSRRICMGDDKAAHSRLGDYYKILEVDYDATEETIRSNYIRLALKWHPDKRKDEDSATSRFQEINEAYKAGCMQLHEQSSVQGSLVLEEGKIYIVLSDPVKRREYDTKGVLYVQDYDFNDTSIDSRALS
ncbi:hypothetical protein QJS10_CPB19g01534 [Acorus calamus]|uniref:J domain-containing protein n=1 Tax=Acorus calamus TaxID=4465 RepID=A0AAV9CJ62_ACOCL|nr:hypothetical protein QJS10_CPB19g01534 [Acorus calamus]